jgi:DNA-binding CsgD family transcriptional regulator
MRDKFTERQKAVLRLIAERKTVKEMAAELQVSESAINQRIKTLKQKAGVHTQRDLALFYDDSPSADAPETCSETASRKKQVNDSYLTGQFGAEDDSGASVTVSDVANFAFDTPWSGMSEPKIVPGVLDGNLAGLSRTAAILGIATMTLVVIMVAVGTAQALTNLIQG